MTIPKTKLLVDFLALFCGSAVLMLMILPLTASATFTKQINYQGKLTDTAGNAIADGDYDLEFKLYTALTGGAAIWTETRAGANQVTVTDGLFSVMLGEVSSLDAINFDQALYLSVNVESDGEMTPRKILGSVASAFEADNAFTFDGFATTSFLRADASNASATIVNASTTYLTIATDAYLSTFGSTYLAVNASGRIIATTTPLLSFTESDPVWTSEKASYVPYTGATTGVNLGSNTLTLTGKLSGGVASTTALSVSGQTYLTGKVGIGNIAPVYNLDVTGYGRFTEGLYLTALESAFLSVDQAGYLIATTTPVLTETDPVWTAEKSTYLLTASFNGLFDPRLHATTSLPNLSTLAGLSTVGSSTGQTTILGKTVLTNASTTNLSASGFLTVAGNVGIGNIAPAYDLDVTGYGRFTREVIVQERLGVGTSTVPTYALDVVGFDNDVARFRNVNLGTTCTLTSGTGIITCSSDLRLKKNIVSLDQNLDKITALNPVAYNWLRESDLTTKSLGFIAQEVATVLPELVVTGDDGYQGLSMVNLIPVIVGAIKEQQTQLQALSASSRQALVSAGQSVGQSLTAGIEAVWGTFERLKTRWLEVEQGITIKDRATGDYYCLYFEGGIQKSLPGRCEEVLADPTPLAPIPVEPLPITEMPPTPIIENPSSTPPIEPPTELIVESAEPEPALDESVIIEEAVVDG